MKVLFVAHGFLPGEMGGVQVYAYHLAQALIGQGLDVEVLFAEESVERTVEHREYDGIRCTVFRKPLRDARNLFLEVDPWVETQFRAVLDRARPDLVHVHHLLRLSTTLPRIAKERGLPVVFSVHDYWIPCARITLLDHAEELCDGPGLLKCAECCRPLYTRFTAPRRPRTRPILTESVRRLSKQVLWRTIELPAAVRQFRRRNDAMREMLAHVDSWIVVNQPLAAVLTRSGAPRERIVVLPHAAQTARPALPARGPHSGRLRFGFLGTIARFKGIHVLLEAFRNVTDAELLVYGAGDKQILRDYKDVVGQPNVHFLGPVEELQKWTALEALDALIVPSICYETGPLVIQEALIAGVPVICSDSVGMRDLVVEGNAGWSFPVGSVSALSRIIVECVRDPLRLRALRPTGDRFQSFDEHVRDHLYPLFRRLRASVPPNEGVPDSTSADRTARSADALGDQS